MADTGNADIKKLTFERAIEELETIVKRLEDGKAELTVEDDGVGIAPNTPHAGTGLGSKIIQTMASALQTRVDGSTGLLNRQAWEDAVGSELRRFKRGGAPAAQ